MNLSQLHHFGKQCVQTSADVALHGRFSTPLTFPTNACWVIVVNESVQVHTGYPEDNNGPFTTYQKMYWTEDRNLWEAAIDSIEKRNMERQSYEKVVYVAFHTDKVAHVERKIVVSVKT